MAHSRSFLANQKARNAIVGAENLLKADKLHGMLVEHEKNFMNLQILWVFFQHPKLVYQKLVVHFFNITIQKTCDFFVSLLAQ